MVVGIRILNLVCSEEENVIQCKELNRDTAQLSSSNSVQFWSSMSVRRKARWSCGQTPLWLSSSALLSFRLLCPARSSALWSSKTSLLFYLEYFSFSWGNAVFNLWWKGKVCSQSHRGADLYKQKSLIHPSLCKQGLQILAVWLAQRHCPDWTERKELWLVSADADGDITAQLNEEVTVLLVEMPFWISFVSPGSDHRITVQAGR